MLQENIYVRPEDRQRRWLTAFTAGIILAYALLGLALLGRVGPADYDQFLVFHELQYWNAALFGLAKQWSPVMCGGLSLAGEPQVPFMSLSMLVSYGLGPLAGLEVAIALYLLMGWVGAFLYASLWWPKAGPRALAASLYIGNGFFACRIAYGHVDLVPFLSLPLMLWALHRSLQWLAEITSARKLAHLALAVLLFAGGVSVVVDGSPVALIHLMFWVGLYALVLALTIRRAAPLLLLGAAVLLAALLDAGYLWPMFSAQRLFPRLTPDSFTNPLALAWFALLPVTGKLVVPATGNGHELSVYVGPVLAYLIWRYRQPLMASLPVSMKQPLIIVSLISVWLGMGSLAPLHVPRLLSLYDLLRPLPGFRSLWVTGRYWGFLALPLSLLAAGALWSYARSAAAPRSKALWLGAALVLQLGFQTGVILNQWIPGRIYQPVRVHSAFRDGPDTINFVPLRAGLQGRLIGPTQGVTNCYDNDDYVRARVAAGSNLIQAASIDPPDGHQAPPLTAKFATWSRLRLQLDEAAPPPRPGSAPDVLQIVLNQAYHPLWRANSCQTSRGSEGNLVLECPYESLSPGPLWVQFRDPVSARGANVSRRAWVCWLVALGLTLSLLAFQSSLAPTAQTVNE
jgi:hypothetical protein